MLDEILKIIAKYQHSPLVHFVEKVRLVNTALHCNTTCNPFVRGNRANLGAGVGFSVPEKIGRQINRKGERVVRGPTALGEGFWTLVSTKRGS